jgi:hypothetical protein
MPRKPDSAVVHHRVAAGSQPEQVGKEEMGEGITVGTKSQIYGLEEECVVTFKQEVSNFAAGSYMIQQRTSKYLAA